MREQLKQLLKQALEQLVSEGVLSPSEGFSPRVERTRDPRHGDFATNIALLLAKQAKAPPRQLAERIVAALPNHPHLQKIEIAGPGFINFFIDPKAQFEVVRKILEEGEQFGRSRIGEGKQIHIEFVSANPTGPLHVGHGRGAAYGATVANLLEAIGYRVHREYYVNDAGRQVDILALSIWLRYLEKLGEPAAFPEKGYRGNYLLPIAEKLLQQEGRRYHRPWKALSEGIELDFDEERYLDALVSRAKTLLGEEAFREIARFGVGEILQEIREDLEDFGVWYDEWFFESRLVKERRVEAVLAKLRAAGYLYEKDGAVWFASSRFGDEKDRVVVRENGLYTYFATDIAYHLDKFERGFDRTIDIWGADHHGYVPRLKAAMQALGFDSEKLEVRLVQFAVLYRGKEKVSMSTRAGEFVTLRQLLDEVGKDAARFFYVMRKADQHLDFDLEFAVSQSNENPVYYVQYAHARICSVFHQLRERGGEWDRETGLQNLDKLTENHERGLLTLLDRYPEVVENAALLREPHQLIHYLGELAAAFHTYYNAHTFLVEDEELRNARLALIEAVRQVVANGLGLIDVSAPVSM